MANSVSFKELYTKDFNIDFFIAAKQHWKIHNKFSCINSPKPNDMLLYLHGCSAKYTTRDGKIYHVPKNSIVYAPRNSEYTFECTHSEDDIFSTIIVNFNMYDENGEALALSDNIKIINMPNHQRYEKLFLELFEVSSQNLQAPCAMKAGFYKLMTEICRHFHNENIFSKKFQVISKGILYLEESDNIKLSVKEIARMCNVSEIYFRRLFKEYSGITPIQFIINKKIERAKQCLIFEEMTVSETADFLGFCESGYFCRKFKEKTGISPGEYKQKYSRD